MKRTSKLHLPRYLSFNRLTPLLASFLLTPAWLPSAPLEWQNTGADWATGANWIGGVAPASSTTTDTAVFGSFGASAVNPVLAANRSIGGISFLSGAYAYSFSSTGGALLTIGSSGILNSSTVLQTFNGPLAVSISQTWTTADIAGSTLFNGTLDLNASAATSRTLTISGAGLTTFGNIQNSFAGSTGSITIGATGSVVFNGTNSYNGSTRINSGVLRLNTAAALPGGVAATGGASALLFGGSGTNGGVLGLTAATGDFLRPIGSTSPTASQVGWASGGTGGFAAFGGDRVVNFGGAGASVTWNSGGGVLGGGLILGHATSDSTITVVNPIAFNAAARTVIVNDGTASVDAIMSGAMSGTASSLIKNGSGTLALTGANIYGSATTTGTTFTTISAGVLQIGIGSTAGSLTSAGTGDIQNDAVLAFNRSNSMTIQYVVKGTGSLRQIGTGTTRLTASNTYSGGTQITTGGLVFGKASSLPTTGTVTVAAGAMMGLAVSSSGDFFTSANVDSLFAGTMANVTNDHASIVGIDTSAGDFTYSSNIPATSRGLSKVGTNTLTLSGTNAYTGTTSIAGGVLDVGVISGGSLGAGGLVFSNSAVLQGSGTFTRTFSGSATAGEGQLTGTSGGFAARGGTLTINFGGAGNEIIISTGNSRFGSNFVFGSPTADSRVIVVNPLDLNQSNRTFTVNSGVGGDSAELQGVVNESGGSYGITKAGTGLLILSAANTYTGATVISAGTLQIGAGGATGSINSTSGVSNGGTLTFNRTGTLAMSAPISGSGVVNQSGTGITTLSGVNTYTGGTNVLSGTLIYLNTSAKPSTGTTTVAPSATLGLGVGSSGSFFTATDLDSLFNGTMTDVSNDVTSRVGIDTSAGDFNYSSSITSTTRGLTKLGTNTLSLSGANAYGGPTTIIGGVLKLENVTAIPGGIGATGGSSNITLSGGIIGLTAASGNFTRGIGTGAGQVRWITDNPGGFTAYGGDRSVNFGGNVTPSTVTWNNTGGVLGSSLLLSSADSDSTITILNPISLNFTNNNRPITVNDGSAAVDAVMAGALSSVLTSGNGTRIIKNGTGTLALTAANSYVSGSTLPATTISAGVLMLGNGGTTGSLLYIPNSTGINSDVSISTGATFAFNRSDAGLTVGNLIIGGGSVSQMGTGTTTLSNANTYAGGTTVSAGTLLLTNASGSGTGSGSVTTNAGTTLGGTGIIAPSFTSSVTIGGSVTPGLSGSAGTLRFTLVDGNVTFQNTSSIALELFGNGSNDMIMQTATGTGLLDFTAMATGSIGVIFAGGYTPALGHSFTLLDWVGISGLSTSQLHLSTTGFDTDWYWDTSLFTSDGIVSIALIPEPSRALLAVMGLLMCILRRHRTR
jgi:fibronectin-binding autotransporter adhesin